MGNKINEKEEYKDKEEIGWGENNQDEPRCPDIFWQRVLSFWRNDQVGEGGGEKWHDDDEKPLFLDGNKFSF